MPDPHFLDPEIVVTAPENEALDDVTDELTGEPETMVTIACCNLAAEAHAMRLHLEAEGIRVFLADEMTIAMDWLLSNAIGGVKVQVAEQDAQRAAQVLAAFPRSSDEDSGIDDEDTEEM